MTHISTFLGIFQNWGFSSWKSVDVMKFPLLIEHIVIVFRNHCLVIIHCLDKSIRTPIIILQTVRVPSNILTFVGASTILYI